MTREFEPIRMLEKHATGKSHDVWKNRWKMRRRKCWKRRWTRTKKKEKVLCLISVLIRTCHSFSFASIINRFGIFFVCLVLNVFLCNLTYWTVVWRWLASRGVYLSRIHFYMFEFTEEEEKEEKKSMWRPKNPSNKNKNDL